MEHPTATSFAVLLRRHRLANGLSQEALAERAGLSARAISDLERGIRRAPYRETIRFLADALALTAADRAALEAAVNRSRGPVPGTRPHPESSAPSLPAAVTSLIGRGPEVALLRDWLLRGGTRLLTLTGAPGIGKTRLALAVATELVNDYQDGVIFVALSPISDPRLVATTILQGLDVPDLGGPSAVDRLRYELRPKQTLLVLDNFEQVIAAAPLVGQLLEGCPRLSVLVTSRVALHLRGEHEFPVLPLALPNRAAAPVQAMDVESLGDFSALTLFVERARGVRPDFELTPHNAGAVVEICHRLDGLPLGIELAAARCKVLSPRAMLGRLEHRLQLLTDGARDAPERQRSLRGAIAWSHDLLSPAQRVLFRRLGIFVGGCTLEAAERVCDVAGDLDLHVFDDIAALVDQSLLQHGEDAGGEPRFVMLETLREYALERLESAGERQLLQARLAADVLALAQEAEPYLFSAERGQWLRRLSDEQDNIRATLRWTLADGEPALGLSLVGALWMWFLRRLLVEGRQWAEALLVHPAAGQPTLARASALFAAGHFAWLQGEVRVMRARLEESVAIQWHLGDEAGLGRSLPFLGLAIDDDHALARLHAEQGVAICRARDDQWGLAIALTNLGRIEATWGHDAAARPSLEEATTLFRTIGDRWLLALPLNSLGTIAYRAGNFEQAQRAFAEALPCFRAVEDRRNTAQVLTNLGFVALARNEPERSRLIFAESLTLGREHSDRFNTPACLRGFAAIATTEGDPRRAVRLLAAADALFAATGALRWPAERIGGLVNTDELRAILGEETFATAWHAGRNLSLDDAAAEARAPIRTESPA